MVGQRKGESREAYLERHREAMRKYRAEHPGRKREAGRKYYQKHCEQEKAHQHKYRQEHREQAKARSHAYRMEHPEHYKKYYQENCEQEKARSRRHKQNHPEQTKAQCAKQRGLGFDPLNDYVKGSHGHHMDHGRVIFIPAALHLSVRHHLDTGEGMEEINALALAHWAGDEST